MISDTAKARIIEAAKEIIDARTESELSEAARAMAAVITHFGIQAE